MKSEGQQRALKQADCYISKGDVEVLIQAREGSLQNNWAATSQ